MLFGRMKAIDYCSFSGGVTFKNPDGVRGYRMFPLYKAVFFDVEKMREDVRLGKIDERDLRHRQETFLDTLVTEGIEVLRPTDKERFVEFPLGIYATVIINGPTMQQQSLHVLAHESKLTDYMMGSGEPYYIKHTVHEEIPAAAG